MTTATTTPPQLLAFRCSKCFQTRCCTSNHVGQAVPCELCGNENIVPEATEERVAQALRFIESSASENAVQTQANAPAAEMTDEEIMLHCRQQTLEKAGAKALVCSKLQRFLGMLIDFFVVLIAIAIGAIAASFVVPPSGMGEEASPLVLCITCSLAVIVQLIQMVLIACEGRTIGKYCLNMKIVDAKGNPPGFVRGILLRCFVNGALGMIPFYGLIDALAIFANDSNRCIHDHIAGTYVIHAT